MRKAWCCECDIVCKGRQFFQSQSPLQMKWFRDHHANQMPHEMLQTTINDTNATICSNCAIDAKPRELCVGRTFSFRNGFGPIINYEDDPESLVLYHQNMQIGICLQHFMKYLILVEESAN